jgi:cystathionine beta-lyase
MSSKDTKLVEAGRKPSLHAGVVNTPVYRASTVLFPDIESMMTGSQAYTYGRRGTPSTRALEEAIAMLEGGARTVLTSSGLSACTLAIVTTCGVGDHILVTDSVYGPTRVFCERTAKRFGIETTYFPPALSTEELTQQFRDETKAVFLESPGSLTFEVQDVPAIAKAAHERNIAVILDNTWATPLFFNAIGHGVDLSVQAATKYLGGHADLHVGSVTANAVWRERLVETHGNFGHTIGGDDAFLTLRGMRTLSLRMHHQQESARAIAGWLRRQPQVKRVIYPALPGDAGYDLWKRDFTGAASLFSVVLHQTDDKAIAAFIDGLKLFGIGYSWGGFESLVLPAHFRRSFPSAKDEGPIVRFHIGLEDVDELKADLAAGLARLDTGPSAG